MNKVPQDHQDKTPYNFIAPVTVNGDDVSFDIDLWQDSSELMALQSSDLLYVQRGADGYKMNAGEIIDFIAGSPAIVYRGTVDC